jgi:hypothetical protein
MHYHFKVHKEGNAYWAECCEFSAHTCTDGPGTLDDLRKQCVECLDVALYRDDNDPDDIPMPNYSLDNNKRLLKIPVEPGRAFSMLLKKSRLRSKLTQKEAAARLGMKNLYSYQRLEKKPNPTLAVMERVWKAFPDIKLEYLFR